MRETNYECSQTRIQFRNKCMKMRWCLPKINVYVCVCVVGRGWSMCLDLYFGKNYPFKKINEYK